mmetsp:Transcript_23439/g.51298  ORF Transcript_23439/g.51298 Transcript_23439/m.51298 type:complete len:305 (+) Transcript_23439:941-1855(+)
MACRNSHGWFHDAIRSAHESSELQRRASVQIPLQPRGNDRLARTSQRYQSTGRTLPHFESGIVAAVVVVVVQRVRAVKGQPNPAIRVGRYQKSARLVAVQIDLAAETGGPLVEGHKTRHFLIEPTSKGAVHDDAIVATIAIAVTIAVTVVHQNLHGLVEVVGVLAEILFHGYGLALALVKGPDLGIQGIEIAAYPIGNQVLGIVVESIRSAVRRDPGAAGLPQVLQEDARFGDWVVQNDQCRSCSCSCWSCCGVGFGVALARGGFGKKTGRKGDNVLDVAAALSVLLDVFGAHSARGCCGSCCV